MKSISQIAKELNMEKKTVLQAVSRHKVIPDEIGSRNTKLYNDEKVYIIKGLFKNKSVGNQSSTNTAFVDNIGNQISINIPYVDNQSSMNTAFVDNMGNQISINIPCVDNQSSTNTNFVDNMGNQISINMSYVDNQSFTNTNFVDNMGNQISTNIPYVENQSSTNNTYVYSENKDYYLKRIESLTNELNIIQKHEQSLIDDKNLLSRQIEHLEQQNTKLLEQNAKLLETIQELQQSYTSTIADIQHNTSDTIQALKNSQILQAQSMKQEILSLIEEDHAKKHHWWEFWKKQG